MTQQPITLEEIQQEIAVLRLDNDRKFNQLITDGIARDDNLRQLSATVNQLSATVGQTTQSVNQLAAEAASDRLESREDRRSIYATIERMDKILDYLIKENGNSSPDA